MLATALDQHPDLKVAGEVLVRPERYGVYAELEEEGQPCLTIEDTWSKYNGFINHRHHASPWTWNYISGLSDVIFISLKRRNMLAALVSQKIADKTEIWHLQQAESALLDAKTDDWVADARPPEVQVEIPFKEADEFLRTTRRRCQDIDQQMMNFRHPFLELYYEDLGANWTHWLSIVQTILGVQPLRLLPATRKQEQRPLSESIANFDSLRDQASDKEAWWKHMLEE
jgi:LPS sulfotransferase NodH